MLGPTFEEYRDQIAALLKQAHTMLKPGQLDRLGFAIRTTRRDGIDLSSFGKRAGAHSAPIGRRLLSLLADADRDLPPEQVTELEVLIRQRLETSPEQR